MKAKPMPSVEYLHDALRLDAQTGRLFWRYREDMPLKWNARFAGKQAGYRRQCRAMITINCERFFVSRIIFKMVKGYEPEIVDHINRDKGNHAPDNLRSANKSQNAANSQHRKRPVHNLPRGVFASSSKTNPYKARVAHKHLGMFRTISEAANAVKMASKAEFGEFSNV